MSFFTELRRRRVLSIASAYIAIAWLVTEIAGFLLEQVGAPPWGLRLLAIVLMVGFPLAMVLAWIIQIGPDGKCSLDPSGGQHKIVIGAIASGIIATAGLSWLILPSIEDAPAIPTYDPLPNSVAVLPFLNPDATPHEIDIGETLYVALTNSLGKSRELTQVNLKSLPPSEDPVTFGRSIRIATLLTGRVLRSAGSTRVEMSLLDIGTGKPLWVGEFEWVPRRIKALVTEISNGVLRAINLPVMTEKQFTGTDNPEAYRARLLASRHAWSRFNTDGLKLAMADLQKAIELDPEYLQAHAALTNTIKMYLDLHGPDGEERRVLENQMQQAFETAQKLGPDSPEVLRLLGRFADDIAVKCRAFDRMVELDPEYGADLRYIIKCVDDPHEQERLKRKAVELDPLNSNLLHELAMTLYEMGRIEEAWVEINKAIEIDPENSWNWGYAATFEFLENHVDRAIYRQRKACELNPLIGVCAARVGFYYANLGAEEEALAWIDKAMELSPGAYYVWSSIAESIARLGRIEMAYEYIEEATQLFRGNSTWFLVQVSRDLNTGEKEKALQRAYKFYPQFAADDEFVLDQDNIRDVLDYSWVLLEAGEEGKARHLANRSLGFLDEYCSLPGTETDKETCNLRYRVHAYFKDRLQTLDELRRLIIEEHNLAEPYLAPHMGLSFLHDDTEFQRLMVVLAEIKTTQLEAVREMELNGEMPPAPWQMETTP